nr:putative ribonuclease H-like domain-containing protein [Tanacetum cinerariifolium]
IQQYLQNEHYALWEVIEFGDSYEAPKDESGTGSASESSAKKNERTVAVTTEDMQKRRNDVKARTTLLLALPDEYQLRFNKYKTAQELWAAILKTFGGNEATKKTKKNQLKQQYGNFKAEGSETLEQTFNRLQAIISHLKFIDVEIEQDDMNQKFLTSLALEWLMYTIVWRNRSDLDTISLDDLYNHLKVYEPEVQKKSKSNSHNMAFISSAKNSNGKGEVNTASILTANIQVSLASADVAAASFTHDPVCAYIASQSNGSQIKYEDINQIDKDDIEEIDIKWNIALLSMRADRFWKKTGKKITIQGLSQVKARLVEFKNQEIKFCEKIRGLEFNVESKNNRIERLTNELEELKKEKEGLDSKLTADSPTVIKTNKDETVRKYFVKYAEMYRKTSKSSNVRGNSQNITDDKGYWDSGCSRHMTGNISYLSDYEPYDGGYVSFGQGGGKITGKDDKNVLLRTPRQHNMYSIDLNNIVPHKDLTCLVAKASADESMLWHRRLGHLNFKTMNKLVRHNLVKGLPSKCFENDHTCVACLKGKQHKASCKNKLVHSVSKPLHTLHMDLFGPTFVSSLNHKWYCLVVTDEFSSFTWTFFLKTKDETSGILRNFITEIENLKELKVKIIGCDNRGEFKNKEMNDFCSRKGTKREFSNARTPQQNGVAEGRNMTLIEAARAMLANAKLPVTFWAEAVNTVCYVQNRVLSSVENLIPIPSESEGIPEHMCDVPFHDNSPPLDVLKDQFKDFSESNEEFSSTDDDSFSFDKIDYVEASPLDSELVSSEVMEILPPNLTPLGESDFCLEFDAFLAVEDEPTSSQFPKSYLDSE